MDRLRGVPQFLPVLNVSARKRMCGMHSILPDEQAILVNAETGPNWDLQGGGDDVGGTVTYWSTHLSTFDRSFTYLSSTNPSYMCLHVGLSIPLKRNQKDEVMVK